MSDVMSVSVLKGPSEHHHKTAKPTQSKSKAIAINVNANYQ